MSKNKVRLQKFLSSAGVCSRRKGEEYIKAGRVAVNGEVVSQPGISVDPGTDRVTVDGTAIRDNHLLIYIMLNKPAGYITSRSHGSRKIVFDLVGIDQRLNPVGRLDKDSTGLLLLTNDGELHHRLIHPSFDHEKEYVVETAAPIEDRALERFENGLILDGQKTRPARVERTNARKFRIVLQEGRKRQIRRMVAAVGGRVASLHRIRMGTLVLGNLKEGKWRYLSPKEVRFLRQSCGF
jgi:23S rRNA pseudouridine2605 synthase/23S rRNA pseudouridine2604 synthase